jgi:hypothetical protein
VTVAPDFVEPVIGWRVWYAVEDAGSIRLSSIIHKTLWPAGAPLAATCRRLRIPLFSTRKHVAPSAECRCGIYATTPPALREYLAVGSAWADVVRIVPVLGRTSLWGTVHESEHGWRASMAYPKELFVPTASLRPPWAERVMRELRSYRVPVRPVSGTTVDGVLDEVATLTALAA